nr:hypothetical protein [Moraxella osloensis]
MSKVNQWLVNTRITTNAPKVFSLNPMDDGIIFLMLIFKTLKCAYLLIQLQSDKGSLYVFNQKFIGVPTHSYL